MRRLLNKTVCLGLLGMALFPCVAPAQQQFQGVCSRVEIEILQEMTLERIGFLATLWITNNETEAPITDFSATLTFEDVMLSTDEETDDSSDLFFVQAPLLTGIADIDGSGVIPATQTAQIEWFIIPKTNAGGTEVTGRRYGVGVSMSGSLFGTPITPELFQVIPDIIHVRPEAQLDVTYFQPRDVTADNPFTPDIVEAPIPFVVGVLVTNGGYGQATSVKIKSEQPRIVENEGGLLLIAQLLGARVSDALVADPSLTVNLGDIPPGSTMKGAWDMITSLSGEFVEFNASFTHASDLGGEDTSVIKSMTAYFIEHEVLSDLPGRDGIRDFLADTDDDDEHLPDTLYETDGGVFPVNVLANASSGTTRAVDVLVTATAEVEGWAYIRVDDPNQAKFGIRDVTRSDGRVLNPHNTWTNIRYREENNEKLTYLNLFDFVGVGDYTYTVRYVANINDNTPPLTTLRFAGEVTQEGTNYYVSPETQMYFTVEDDSPVGIYYRLDEEGDFLPAYPFTILESGAHTVEYYSIDNVGNREATQSATVILSGTPPAIASFALDNTELFAAGDALSVRPTELGITYQGETSSAGLSALLEVYQGVAAWPTIAGVPVSPTPATTASLTVSGTHVDYYRYRLGAGAWSEEAAVGEPLALIGLAGDVTVQVNGRNEHGDYLPDEVAPTVAWTINDEAPAATITGVPATATRATSATLNVTIPDVAEYRYRLDNTYFRPVTAMAEPIELDELEAGEHIVDVIYAVAGAWPDVADEDAVEERRLQVRWTVDPSYGADCAHLVCVRQVETESASSEVQRLEWDGRTESGSVAVPGWYTAKLTLTDSLGRTVATAGLVEVADMMSAAGNMAGTAGAPQGYPDAAENWLVWQEQVNGNWEIYAASLSALDAPVAVTTEGRNQERPRTDGDYVVWESRRPDGNWDIWMKQLGSADPAIAVTDTPDLEERRPVISWPRVAYQVRPSADPDAPWQVRVHDLLAGTSADADASEQDQLAPDLWHHRLVWQDWRDVGNGEIYLKNFLDDTVTRVTTSTDGQYHPAVHGRWIVWTDTRHDGQNELYGYDELRQTEIRLTDTAENEARPSLTGGWVVYTEDTAGVLNTNVRALHLPTLATVQLTNTLSQKQFPVQASGRLAWIDDAQGHGQLLLGNVPALQPVFANTNLVVVSETMAQRFTDAEGILQAWSDKAGLDQVTRYTGWPNPAADTATLSAPERGNFPLNAGGFVSTRFRTTTVLDLGERDSEGAVELQLGTNVVARTDLPDDLSAYSLIRGLGTDKVAAVRMLDASAGKWQTTVVAEGTLHGPDFDIDSTAVILIDMKEAVADWIPSGTDAQRR